MHLQTLIMLKNKAPSHLIQLNFQWTPPHTRAIADLSDSTQTTTNLNNQTMNFSKLPADAMFTASPEMYHASGRNNVNRPSGKGNTWILSPYPARTTGCSQLPGWRWDSGVLWPCQVVGSTSSMNQAASPAFSDLLLPVPVEAAQRLDPLVMTARNNRKSGDMYWSNQKSYILD